MVCWSKGQRKKEMVVEWNGSGREKEEGNLENGWVYVWFYYYSGTVAVL